MIARRIAIAVLSAAMVVGAAPAHADPDDPPGPPPAPGIGIPNLTPEQQCAYIAWRTMTPCNWIMPKPPPPGTPGTLYGPPQ